MKNGQMVTWEKKRKYRCGPELVSQVGYFIKNVKHYKNYTGPPMAIVMISVSGEYVRVPINKLRLYKGRKK